MIAALMLDCEDSVDFPGNDGVALGRPLPVYPLMAAKGSGRIGQCYVVTASQPVKSAAVQYGAILIDPPPQGAAPAAAEGLLRHGWKRVLDEQKGAAEPELLVVLFAHAPTVTAALIDEGLSALHERPELDSAVSVSPYNRWNPFCARRLDAGGLLEPYLPAAAIPDRRGADAWFPDWGVQVLRPACLKAAGGQGSLPWLGKKIFPLKQWGGGPVDYQWQIPAVEYWLKKHGASDSGPALEPQPKPQLAPKTDRR